MNEQLLKKSEAQDLTQPLKRHWIIVVTAFFSVVFTVGLFTLFAVPQYEAVGTLIFRKSGDLTSQMFDIPAVLMQKYMIKNQIAVLESRQLAIDVIEELKRSPHADSLIVLGYGSQDKLEKTGKIKFTLKEMIDTYRKSIKVTYSEETDIIELSARSPQPWEAAFLVNTWMLIYKEMDRIQSRGEFTESRSFLEIT